MPRKSDSRRQEARRRLSKQRPSLGQKLARSVHPSVMLIWVGFYAGCLVVLLSGGESMPWQRDQLVKRDINARVAFEIEDHEQTKKDKAHARASVPNIFICNPAPIEEIRNELTALLQLAKSSSAEMGKLKSQIADKGWTIDDAGLATLLQYAGDDEKNKEYSRLVAILSDRLAKQNIVKEPKDPNREGIAYNSILRQAGKPDLKVPTDQLHFVTDRKQVKNTAEQVVEPFPETLRGPIADLIARTLQGSDPQKEVYNPLWRYDLEANAKAMQQAADSVEPSVTRWQQGATLVEAGTVLSPKELDLLKVEHTRYLQEEKTNPILRQKKWLTEYGLAFIVLIVTIGFVSYTYSYQIRIFQKPARALGLTGMMFLMILLSRLVERAEWQMELPVEFSVAFVVIAAALLTIAYDQRFAFGAGGALSVLITLSSRGDLGLFLTLMAVMGVTVFALKEVRTRSKIIAVGGMAAVAAFLASLATRFIEGEELKYVFVHGLVAGFAALFAGFIVQGILPNFEKIFGIATSMTLLEWCDASRPLLRRLAQEAPGTYSHSLVLGQLAEEASEAMGGRGLLARVGALYHDIGKIQKSAYFVENQEARMSRHDRLSPTMSLLIIVGHVKDGVELARAYGLPRILSQFIAEHHGTTVVKYFHHVASEAAAKNSKTKGRHDRQVPESEFRYPGPKPRSKESAILMICDGCEGAVRALDEPTPGRIESTVHQVAMDRLKDGQFDDCDVTMRELKLVEQSLVKSLCAIHHGRIKYPKGSAERDRETAPSEPAEDTTREASEDAIAKPSRAAEEVPMNTDTSEVAHRA